MDENHLINVQEPDLHRMRKAVSGVGDVGGPLK